MRMWYTIKRTVKDPRSPQVLTVQRVEDGKVCEYKVKEEVEQVVQEECKVRFNLAHKAPEMKHVLANKLRYLANEELAKSIVEGTYKIPTNLDEATRYILQEIGNGYENQKQRGRGYHHFPRRYQEVLKRMNELTASSLSSIHYNHYKASVQHKMSSKFMHSNLL